MVYLCPEPVAEAAGDHAPGVRLEGQHGAEMPPEPLPDEETTATGLDERDAEAGRLVADEELPGPEEGLKAQEPRLHLRERRKRVMSTVEHRDDDREAQTLTVL